MSNLILSKSKDRMPLHDLARLILKFIFDRKSCSLGTQSTIETNILNWYKIVQIQKRITAEKYGLTSTDFQPVGTKGSLIDEIEFFLQTISFWLVQDEKGGYDKLKGLWKQHKIDYRKTQRFGWLYPEQYTKEGFDKAREHLRKAMEQNPDDYA